jgi:hypothetical protein
VKRISLACLAVALAAAARGDLTVTQQIQQEGSQQGMSMTLKVKEGKMRVDHSQISSIIDVKTGDVTSLIHPQKMVMKIPGSSLKGIQSALKREGSENATAEPPTPTGRKETISGYACEEYETKSHGADILLWVTKDLPDAEKLMAQLSTLPGDTDPFQGVLKDRQVPGFPIRTMINAKGSGKTTVTVVAVSQDPISDSEFAIPDGYRAVQVPAFPSK